MIFKANRSFVLRHCKSLKYAAAVFFLFLFLMTLLMSGKSSSSLQSETVWDPGTGGGSLEDSHYNQDTYRSTLDTSHLVSSAHNFKDKLLARQVEMRELIRNISASMSANPLVREIQASRDKIVQHRYTNTNHLARSGDGGWQPVSGTSHKFYVYSAYCDDRDKPLVRIIAATKTKKSDKVLCKLFYEEENSQTRIVQAGINVIRENWNLNYSAAFLTCSLAPGLPCPAAVSILHPMDREPPSNYLKVQNHKTGLKDSRDAVPETIGVCVKPLHFSYNKSLELLQFIELNRILGVSRFTLYNDTVSDEVSCLLSHYIKQGIVVLLPWKLDMTSQKEIRTEGLFAALNDCLYRNMKKVQYLVMMDLDELIIPYQSPTLTGLLADLSKRSLVQAGRKVAPQQVSSYSFQNGFFYLQWPDRVPSSSLPLPALTKTRRRHKLHPPKQRSKYICLPTEVKEAGNHFVWEFWRGKTLNVPSSYGLLHHYRKCEFGGDDCVSSEYVEVSRVPQEYGQTLVENVLNTVRSSNCQVNI